LPPPRSIERSWAFVPRPFPTVMVSSDAEPLMVSTLKMLVNELAPDARFSVLMPLARLTDRPLTSFRSVSVSLEMLPTAKSLPVSISSPVTLSELAPLATLMLSLPPPMSMVRPLVLAVRLTESLPPVPTRCSTLARFKL
jgi:hypothetical protein